MIKKSFYSFMAQVLLIYFVCVVPGYGQLFSNPWRQTSETSTCGRLIQDWSACGVASRTGSSMETSPCDCCGDFGNNSICSYPSYYGTRRSLFNGEDLTGWTNVKGEKPGEGWKVVDGTIFRESNAGDLYAEGKFENFSLEFEFKISEKGNSGVKYRSWNTDGFGLGCEYQIYDDVNDSKNPPKYQTASLYDVIVPREGTGKIKMGEFNRGKIIVLGDHIEHYLNDELIMSVDVGSNEWNEGVQKSKFKDVEEFGVTRIGRIFLQDHNCKVWFKELYITELQPTGF